MAYRHRYPGIKGPRIQLARPRPRIRYDVRGDYESAWLRGLCAGAFMLLLLLGLALAFGGQP